jgi:hypothetical protein
MLLVKKFIVLLTNVEFEKSIKFKKKVLNSVSKKNFVKSSKFFLSLFIFVEISKSGAIFATKVLCEDTQLVK